MAMVQFNAATARHLRARATVWMPALAVLLFVSVYLPIASSLLQATSSSTLVAAAPTQTTQAPATTAPVASPVVTTPPPSVTAHPVVITPTCSPLSFGMPSQLALSAAPTGLSVQQDSPTFYQIYGTTASALRSQIQHCAPGSSGTTSAEFTAQTSYNLVWQYDTTMSSSCHISNVKVGLHTEMALPQWNATSSATPGLSGRWQSFMASLTTHEQGHATLNTQYAGKLVNDLNALGSMNCADVNATVTAVVNADVAALNQANDTYDAQTNHGATQGAVLPSN